MEDFSERYGNLIVRSCDKEFDTPCIFDPYRLHELRKRCVGECSDSESGWVSLRSMYERRLQMPKRECVDRIEEEDGWFRNVPWSAEQVARRRKQHEMMIAIINDRITREKCK
jgi:hypothetical protein